ncbi:hypothetical protein VTN77DRAFT_3785 [Rasamsonia byssochlamydoides]|uniref:uncharacterized protein n=1 Tax=Rasamsonia byssochlamydoides TaxID=89139 RepID=UPI003741F189
MDFAPGDPRNPRSWSARKKSLISMVCVISYFVVLFANANYISSIPGVQRYFHVGNTLAVLPITLYSFGFSVGPTFGTAFSEIFGRQYFYKALLALSLVFTIVAATAKNYATLALGRLLAGTLASPCVGIFAGVINDLWDYATEPLGNQFIVMYSMFGAFAPLVGPVSGSAVVADTGDNWRWTFWLSAILLGFCVVINFLVPETFAPRILRSINNERSSLSVADSLRVGFSRPLHMLLVEPIMLPTAAYGAVVQGMLFVYYVAFPYVLETQYFFSVYHVGLSFLSLLVGSMLAFPIISIIDKKIYQKAKLRAEARGEAVAPEERLWCCNIGSIMLPISLFWLAWTAKSSIHWAVPVMSGVLFGCSFPLNLLGFPWYKNEIYGATYGASAFAVENMMRYLFSSFVPLFTIPMIQRLTFHWTMSFWGFVSLTLLPVPWVIYRRGPQLRSKSNVNV